MWGSQSLTLDIDVDMLSFFELMDYTKQMRLKNIVELYICPMDKTDKLVNVLTNKDILDISNELDNGDTLDIYVTHASPLMVVDLNATGPGVGRTNSKTDKVTINLEEQKGEPVEEEEIEKDDEGELDDENDSDFDNSSEFESDGVDVDVHDDNQYGSDVHKEFGEYREVLRKHRRKMSERPKDKVT
ncbi:uncharacterized protein [Nicotiana tomentosiformis]|uniref:uncharacterized protein n=1 Tax=Nicotiana tomentosiformis TaxID=4098 RepID=UPI0014459815|nr:uncharacterized protein LOC104100462 [Nicotiana tomentosiformis]XP_033513077.1 uncharacterized protein LOC104100462 [Nicotiana tomentosiformis]